MSKRPGRHRAREFARGVDGSGTPSSSVAKLVSLVNAIRGVPQRATSGHRGNVRTHLVATARAGVAEAPRATLRGWLHQLRRPTGLAAAAITCTALITAVGLSLGTSKALPGDTLYGMKLRGEGVQLALLGSDEERGHKHLQFAGSRMNEVDRLVEHGGEWPGARAAGGESDDSRAAAAVRLVNRTLRAMDKSTEAGAKVLRRAYANTGETTLISYLDRFAGQQQTSLRKLIPLLPDGSQASAEHSLNYVGDLHDETTKLLAATCASTGSCDNRNETSAANSTSESTSDDPESTSAQASDPDSSASSTESSAQSSTGSSPTEESSSGSTTEDDDPSTGGSSSSGAGDSGSSSGSEDPSGSDTPTSSPSSSPPQPTGVPSSPSDSDSGSKSSTRISSGSSGSSVSSGSTQSGDGAGAASSGQDASEPGD